MGVKLNFNREDASQIAIGAFTLAVPISFSEEAWKLGESLPALNLLLLFLLSIVFLTFFRLSERIPGRHTFSNDCFYLANHYCLSYCNTGRCFDTTGAG